MFISFSSKSRVETFVQITWGISRIFSFEDPIFFIYKNSREVVFIVSSAYVIAYAIRRSQWRLTVSRKKAKNQALGAKQIKKPLTVKKNLSAN